MIVILFQPVAFEIKQMMSNQVMVFKYKALQPCSTQRGPTGKSERYFLRHCRNVTRNNSFKQKRE